MTPSLLTKIIEAAKKNKHPFLAPKLVPHGFGEWCFDTLEEAQDRLKTKQSFAAKGATYKIRSVTITFEN